MRAYPSAANLTRRTVSLRVEQFGKAWVFLQEREIFVVARVIAIFRAQLDGNLQILHCGIRFAGEAIERSHRVDDVVGLRRGLARPVKVLAGFVPPAKIHQGNALRIVILVGFRRPCRQARDSLLANSHVNPGAIAQFLAWAFENALEGLLGALIFLLLKMLESLFIQLHLCELGRSFGVRNCGP
jgi:hypothetical protein